jgi:phage shock protein A
VADVSVLSERIKEMREREARVRERMAAIDPHSPRHSQLERLLANARQQRKRLESRARKARKEGASV